MLEKGSKHPTSFKKLQTLFQANEVELLPQSKTDRGTDQVSNLETGYRLSTNSLIPTAKLQAYTTFNPVQMTLYPS